MEMFEDEVGSLFRERLARGDYRSLLDPELWEVIATAGAELGLTNEIGVLRMVLMRLVLEERDPSRLAQNTARIAGVLVQAERAQRALSGEMADGLPNPRRTPPPRHGWITSWRGRDLGVKAMAAALVALPVLMLWRGQLDIWSASREDGPEDKGTVARRVSVRLKDGSPVMVSRRDPGTAAETPLGMAGAAPLVFEARPGEAFELVLRRAGSDPVIKRVEVNTDAARNRYEWALDPD